MSTQNILNLILLLIPILLIQLGLVIFALNDLIRRPRVRGRRWVWGVGLALTALALPTGIILAGLYLVWGRNIEAQNDTY